MTEIETLPYKTLNVFINHDYLEHILGDLLKRKDALSKADQIAFTTEFRRYVTILGFRNPIRAPHSLQLNAYVSAFEQKNEVIPYTLNTWIKLNRDLADKVMKWLDSQGWDNLALEREFGEADGFSTQWPEGVTFEKLVDEFKKAHPKLELSNDDLILMMVWISGRLPREQTNI